MHLSCMFEAPVTLFRNTCIAIQYVKAEQNTLKKNNKSNQMNTPSVNQMKKMNRHTHTEVANSLTCSQQIDGDIVSYYDGELLSMCNILGSHYVCSASQIEGNL